MTDVDPRLVFLLRASARFDLVEAGLVDVDEAFAELIEPFLEIVFPRPANDAEAHWGAPGWSKAALEYHAHRKLFDVLRPRRLQ